MEQRYLLIRRTRFCCSSFSFTKYADSTELKRLHNIHSTEPPLYLAVFTNREQSEKQKNEQFNSCYTVKCLQIENKMAEVRYWVGGNSP